MEEDPPAEKPASPGQLPGVLRVCELFAGIGGWRVALEAVLPHGVRAEISAFDSGPHCSEVYADNFKETCCRRNIEQLDAECLEDFDMWAMSPPCQPFSTTREAKQRDIEDKRCAALAHLSALLPRLRRPPRWIILENVKGFHGSQACERWHHALSLAGFTSCPLLLDSIDFGVPNHRTRYYLLAERSQRFRDAPGPPPPQQSLRSQCGALPKGVVALGPWATGQRIKIQECHEAARRSAAGLATESVFQAMRDDFVRELSAQLGKPSEVLASSPHTWKLLPLPQGDPNAFMVVFAGTSEADLEFLEEMQDLSAEASQSAVSWMSSESMELETSSGANQSSIPRKEIGRFLEENLSEHELNELVVSREVLQRPFAKGLSYVCHEDTTSFCFTGHYGKVLHKSSGSLLYRPQLSPLDRTNPAASYGAVRFFSPKEILNIFGFPATYRLPHDMELKHRYKVVGNSIAVTVARELLQVLLLGEDSSRLRQLSEASRVALALRGSPDVQHTQELAVAT